MTVDGSTVRIEVDAADAAYPVTVDPFVGATQQLVPTASAANDQFGSEVAMHGDVDAQTVVVAAPGDDTTGPDAGAVYIYQDDGTGWVEQAFIAAPAGSSGFGSDVDVHGDLIAVGASLDDNVNGADAGAVYIYEQAVSGGAWSLATTVYECDPAVTSPCGDAAGVGAGFAGNGFGTSVDLADGIIRVDWDPEF